MRRNERTLKMMDNFMAHHESGMTIAEIAEEYHLSSRHIYGVLDEIAKKNHVSRESLLQVVHKPHILSSWGTQPVEKVDTNGFNEHIAAVRSDMDKLQQSVKDSISVCEKFESEMGGYKG